jgi:rod shape-determining protein MreC
VADQGIGEGMGVVSPAGIVGIVVKVSTHYSVVMSLLHKKALVSAMFKKSGTFGTLTWGEKMDYRFANLVQIPMSEKIKAGDTIVSSGFSNTFPKGIMIGEVESFKEIPEQYFYTVRVKLSTDFKNLRYVYVVSDLKKIEKEKLEDDAANALNEKVK